MEAFLIITDSHRPDLFRRCCAMGSFFAVGSNRELAGVDDAEAVANSRGSKVSQARPSTMA
jgi:hypothetical protein